MSEAIRKLLGRFPADNVATDPKEGSIDRIWVESALKHEEAFVALLQGLRDDPSVSRLDLEFQGPAPGPDGRIPLQRVIDLLAEHGPLPHLRKLSLCTEDWVDSAPTTNLSSLANSVPNLDDFDLWTSDDHRLGQPFTLEKLSSLLLRSLPPAEVEILSACSFPNLTTLELTLSVSSKDDGRKVHLALERLLTSGWAPRLKTLFLNTMTESDEPRTWINEAYVVLLPDSPLVAGLKRLDLESTDFTEEQLKRLADRKDAFAHLESFRLCGDSPTWDQIKPTVGNFVTPPSHVRDAEVRDIRTVPKNVLEARMQQREFGYRIVSQDPPNAPEPKLVAGVATAVSGDQVRAAYAVVRADTLEVVGSATAKAAIGPDFGPGFEYYRDQAALLPAFSLLPNRPDLLLVDGHGRAQEQLFGVASHLGKVLDVPSLGCAESLVYGTHDEPGSEACEVGLIRTEDKESQLRIGVCLRTQTGQPPVFVSTGHGLSMKTAANRVLQFSPKTRVPVPILKARELLETTP